MGAVDAIALTDGKGSNVMFEIPSVLFQIVRWMDNAKMVFVCAKLDGLGNIAKRVSISFMVWIQGKGSASNSE